MGRSGGRAGGLAKGLAEGLAEGLAAGRPGKGPARGLAAVPAGPARAAPVPATPAEDFFICDLLAAIPKDDLATMEHPVFSLATRPDRRILRYRHGAAEIEITPSVKGLATIHDKDILIYCVSQLVAALNRGLPTGQDLQLCAHDLLVATNRETSGDGYRRLREAFERLAGTRIVTNIATGGLETTRGFGLIETWSIQRRTRTGRMILVTVKLSDWLYRAVLARSVLTLHRDYFRLRRPLERRLYELARKHCGRQAEWRIGLGILQHKAGSASPRRVFRRMVREVCAGDGLPDYRLALDAADILTVRARPGAALDGGGGGGGSAAPLLAAGIHDTVRGIAPGLDPHWLEQEWRAFWEATGRPALRSPDRAFLAFCRSRAARSRPGG
jgi:hypothetical protein